MKTFEGDAGGSLTAGVEAVVTGLGQEDDRGEVLCLPIFEGCQGIWTGDPTTIVGNADLDDGVFLGIEHT